MSKHRIMKLGG